MSRSTRVFLEFVAIVSMLVGVALIVSGHQSGQSADHIKNAMIQEAAVFEDTAQPWQRDLYREVMQSSIHQTSTGANSPNIAGNNGKVTVAANAQDEPKTNATTPAPAKTDTPKAELPK